MTFEKLGLSAEIARAVTEKGYIEPTKIQAEAIPVIMQGHDLLAGSHTGSGKTAGFTLPILHRLSDKSVKGPSAGRPKIRALVLVPTRELAAQVRENIHAYSKYLTLTSAEVIGGVGMKAQVTRLRSRVDILVATPGRLLDHVKQATVDLSGVEVLVLDEADRMLDMGFILDIKKIMNLLPKSRQNLLFSATFSPEIKKLADGLLNSPKLIEAENTNATAALVTHKLHPVEVDKKRELLKHLILENNWSQVLVFMRTKHTADKLAYFLSTNGIPAAALHSNKSQNVRTRTLADFKLLKIQVLVATDIAARGIDISDLPYVVNFDLPNVPEDYVHRIGRTGRAGKEGFAVSLVAKEDLKLLLDIEHKIKQKITEEVINGFRPSDYANFRVINRSKSKSPSKPANKANTGERSFSGEARRGGSEGGGENKKPYSNRSFAKKPDASKSDSKPFNRNKPSGLAKSSTSTTTTRKIYSRNGDNS